MSGTYNHLSWIRLDPGPTSLLHYILLLLFSRTCSGEAATSGLAPRLMLLLGRELRAGLSLLQFGAISAVVLYSLT